ncbi:olfactory receptor 5V1 [Xenopus laevis]|uniref:Olfactory receptor n=2 Tax=Xenopus laevis TaxID=8355 RepID=A0A1L8FBB7_XENLA|nr:olfactory receptor 5V1 [Xenopus laevis]OCT68899.1 hypothetical protein XELAEV_18040207mg [Xenopus laevis]
MPDNNESSTDGFLLQGFSDYTELQIPLFCLFLMIYLLTLKANLLILIVSYKTSLIQTPMYFFLCNLAFIDIFSSSVYQPKLLLVLLRGDNTISFIGCIFQLHCFMSLACTEFVSLTVMAYDRYVAICNPLRYLIVMNRRFCVILVISCWMVGFTEPLSHTLLVSTLPFCGSRALDHFFCDLIILLKLSCKDTFFIELLTYILGSIIGLPAFILIIGSYIYIVATILKIHSSSGRKKAFSTCTSHVTVVIVFYGSILITYMRPPSQYSTILSKPSAFLYTSITPLINPFIYTLRTKEMKQYVSRRSIVKH